jgi:peptide/nickel transport system substrate-binding protein
MYEGDPEEFAAQLIYSSLVSIDPVTQKPVMRLAQSVTSNTDGTWTIQLRPGLVFSDGTPLNAAAVVSNWDRQKNPAVASDCIADILALGSYKATGDTTVVVNLTTPNVAFPVLLSQCLGLIQSPTAVAKDGKSYGTSVQTTVGAGPYLLTSWVPGAQQTYTRNPHYWDQPRPYINSIVMLGGSSTITQDLNALQVGQVDGLAYSSGLTPQMQSMAKSGYQLYGYPVAGGGIDVSFNETTPGLNDVRVRRALVLATNLDQLNQEATGGVSEMVNTFFAPGTPEYNASVTQPTNNLAEAQQLINQYDATHPAPHITFSVYNGGQAWADPVVQEWSQLKGITVTEDIVSITVMAQRMTTGQFQMAFYGISGSDPYSLYQFLYSKSNLNSSHLDDPAVDAALTQLLSTSDPQKQQALYTTLSKDVFNDAPALFLYRNYLPGLFRKGISGLTPGWSDVAPDFANLQLAS